MHHDRRAPEPLRQRHQRHRDIAGQGEIGLCAAPDMRHGQRRKDQHRALGLGVRGERVDIRFGQGGEEAPDVPVHDQRRYDRRQIVEGAERGGQAIKRVRVGHEAAVAADAEACEIEGRACAHCFGWMARRRRDCKVRCFLARQHLLSLPRCGGGCRREAGGVVSLASQRPHPDLLRGARLLSADPPRKRGRDRRDREGRKVGRI